MFNMGKPTICALNGSAAGYGMDTALGCDIRIMAEGAKMAAAFTKRGIVPESGGTWFLPRLIGWSKAAELIFTGRTLTAAECVDMGLASSVVPDAELPAAARKLAAVSKHVQIDPSSSKHATDPFIVLRVSSRRVHVCFWLTGLSRLMPRCVAQLQRAAGGLRTANVSVGSSRRGRRERDVRARAGRLARRPTD
jgi:enoyl-CoA hydratase/carnithine racemase